MSMKVIQGGLEITLLSHWNRLRYALKDADEVAVAWIAGIGQQPFFAGLGEASQGENQRAGRARGHRDA
jgi:hypothetical protein